MWVVYVNIFGLIEKHVFLDFKWAYGMNDCNLIRMRVCLSASAATNIFITNIPLTPKYVYVFIVLVDLQP